MHNPPDPVAAKKLREAIREVAKEINEANREWMADRATLSTDALFVKILAALTPHLPALTQLPVAGEARSLMEEAAVRLENYDDQERLNAKHEGRFARTNADLIAKLRATPPSAPTNGDAFANLVKDVQQAVATVERRYADMKVGDAAPSSWAVEAAKEVGAPPAEIYLQWNGDQEPDDSEEKHEVTWAKEPVFPHDVRYVIAARQSQSAGDGK